MKSLVLSTGAILLASAAFAQTPPPPPRNPPLAWQQPMTMTIGGTVARFTLTPRGDLDGMILPTAPRCTCRRISLPNSRRR
jgi:hypothetical protein